LSKGGRILRKGPKILFIDIETFPKMAYVWEFWKVNISPKQVLDHGHIMSAAWIWNNDPDQYVSYMENRQDDDTDIVRLLITLLDEADIVVGHNVKRFDTATINARALVLGLEPPSPYKVVDTYQIAKSRFKFESNSLEYLTKILKTKHQKQSHANFPGFELWIACLAGNPLAWDECREYNIDDTLSVRDVYYAMLPWITNHPNHGVYQESDSHICPLCGSSHLHKRGFSYTNVGKYQRYRCTDCGGWSKSSENVLPKGDKRKQLLRTTT
jgi:hypothetical protein